ncbi:RTA1 like protein-domain-containing protein [Fusarium venenatum]|uniref:RTA1 like protein-domain-containing protein n=1 Tax=Fusarium venenatum TaxID=56646 RepID=UPI001E03AB1A|nr:RTA1 like protein-domain-containing protein [Fusarium venenatum]
MAAIKLYHYEPSFIPALVVLGLFFASTLVCLMQVVRCRTWFFIPFLLGCSVETVGYGCRVWSSQESPNWSTLPYAIQTFTLLSGPFLMLATIYTILSKIIIVLDADIHSLVPVKVLPKVFIFGDLISLAAQLTGAAYLVNATEVPQQRTAQLIIVGGLSFHIYFFGFFSSVLHIAYTRVLEAPTRQSTIITMPWRRWIIVLYLSCGLILVRSVYRVIEYATGPLGVVQGTEIYFYVFDSGSIFIITCLFNIFHPRQLATISKDDLPDPETVVVTPFKPMSRYPSQTPPRYMQPPPFLPSHANLRNRGPYFHYPKSQYRSQSFIQYPPPMHYYQQRRPHTLVHHRPRTNRTYKSFNPSFSSSSSVVSIYNPQTGQYEPIRR